MVVRKRKFVGAFCMTAIVGAFRDWDIRRGVRDQDIRRGVRDRDICRGVQLNAPTIERPNIERKIERPHEATNPQRIKYKFIFVGLIIQFSNASKAYYGRAIFEVFISLLQLLAPTLHRLPSSSSSSATSAPRRSAPTGARTGSGRRGGR
jgi:hypothetical protein